MMSIHKNGTNNQLNTKQPKVLRRLVGSIRQPVQEQKTMPAVTALIACRRTVPFVPTLITHSALSPQHLGWLRLLRFARNDRAEREARVRCQK